MKKEIECNHAEEFRELIYPMGEYENLQGKICKIDVEIEVCIRCGLYASDIDELEESFKPKDCECLNRENEFYHNSLNTEGNIDLICMKCSRIYVLKKYRKEN